MAFGAPAAGRNGNGRNGNGSVHKPAEAAAASRLAIFLAAKERAEKRYRVGGEVPFGWVAVLDGECGASLARRTKPAPAFEYAGFQV